MYSTTNTVWCLFKKYQTKCKLSVCNMSTTRGYRTVLRTCCTYDTMIPMFILIQLDPKLLLGLDPDMEL